MKKLLFLPKPVYSSIHPKTLRLRFCLFHDYFFYKIVKEENVDSDKGDNDKRDRIVVQLKRVSLLPPNPNREGKRGRGFGPSVCHSLFIIITHEIAYGEGYVDGETDATTTTDLQ
jgi:hypothetical protein